MAYATLNSDSLSSLELKLRQSLKDMDSDLIKLKNSFDKAEWNDPVAEMVRVEVNEYIDKYNQITENLNGIISALDDMYKKCNDYLSYASN